jgi:rRNA maturation endonuclease Nob1
MNEEFGKTYAGLDFDPEVVGQVFDPDKEQATCPACATEFSTKESECPECGLCFGT